MVGAARSDEAGPVLKFGLPGPCLLRQVEENDLDKLTIEAGRLLKGVA
jgi:hypothetical protein